MLHTIHKYFVMKRIGKKLGACTNSSPSILKYTNKKAPKIYLHVHVNLDEKCFKLQCKLIPCIFFSIYLIEINVHVHTSCVSAMAFPTKFEVYIQH